jgi:hypothetical protein
LQQLGLAGQKKRGELSYHDSRETDNVLYAFCDAHRAKRPFDLDVLFKALSDMGYDQHTLDSSHDQLAPLVYYRHFDPFEGDREVGCKYCGCHKFVEPGEEHEGDHPHAFLVEEK